MIRAVVVDDEPYAREELASLLHETGEVEVVASSQNAVEAIQAIRAHRPDALFLDIQMPGISGFELLTMLGDELPQDVVFVTAHDEHALRAFEAHAVDYLLKPVARDRLVRTIERLQRGPAGRGAAAELRPPIARIPCLVGRAIKLVGLEDVEVAHSSEAGIFVATDAGEFFTELTLKVLEERAALVRCHKQYLVRPERIDEVLIEDGGATLRMRSGRSVPVSRRLLPALRERLGI